MLPLAELEVMWHVTRIAPWGTWTAPEGPGRGSSCWSTWARWVGAAGRGAEARTWREGRLGQAETRGSVPCCRRAGSSCTQLGSTALLDASQSPAKRWGRHKRRRQRIILQGHTASFIWGRLAGPEIEVSSHQHVIVHNRIQSGLLKRQYLTVSHSYQQYVYQPSRQDECWWCLYVS